MKKGLRGRKREKKDYVCGLGCSGEGEGGKVRFGNERASVSGKERVSTHLQPRIRDLIHRELGESSDQWMDETLSWSLLTKELLEGGV